LLTICVFINGDSAKFFPAMTLGTDIRTLNLRL